MQFGVVSARRLYREIAQRLQEKIETGVFPLDKRLPAERDLAEQFNVSRSSVREALIALEIQGYVDIRMGSGIYVCSLLPRAANNSPEFSLDAAADIGPFELLEARLLIETECAALTAQEATQEQLQHIATLHQAIERANSTGNGSITSMGPERYDRLFHCAVADACGNAALASACMHLSDLSERSPVFQRLDEHFVTGAVWNAAWIEHHRIVEAILARDAVRARHAMTFHLHAIMARLRQDPDAAQTLAVL